MKTTPLILIFLLLFSAGCSHQLSVKNLETYNVPTEFRKIGETKPVVAILPFSGGPDDLCYFNSIVTRLSMASGIGELYTDYNPGEESTKDIKPDLVLSIRPSVNYRSSGWNFVINCPGFLIFTPAWNGYVYYADILTQVEIRDKDKALVNRFEIPISYDIRQADFDRTVFPVFGGVYASDTFDRDMIPPFQVQIIDNFSNYVVNELVCRFGAPARSI